MTDLKGTLANIARAIVDSPEDVVVTVTEESESSISLKLTVAAPDMGKVIGKHGKIAKAIRQLMKAAANGTGKKVTNAIEKVGNAHTKLLAYRSFPHPNGAKRRGRF